MTYFNFLKSLKLDSPAGRLVLLENFALIFIPIFIIISLFELISTFFLLPIAITIVFFLKYVKPKLNNNWDTLFRLLFFLSIIIYISAIWNQYNINSLQLMTDSKFRYIPMSKLSLSDLKFWLFGQVPFITPLIFKIFNRNWALINDFFIITYLLSTLLLVYIASCFFKNIKYKLLQSYLLILLFLNQSNFSFWLKKALSEVPAIVLTLLTISLFGFCYKNKEFINKKNSNIVLTISIISIFAFLFSFTRDTNMYFLIIIAGFYFLVFKRKKHALILTLVLLSIFFLDKTSMEKSGRWKFCLTNVVLKRIIPEKKLRLLFQQKYHLPESKLIMPGANKWASAKFKNKEFIFSWDDANKDWVSKYGLKSYKFFLIKHPVYVFQQWIKNFHLYNLPLQTQRNKKIKKKLNIFIFYFPGSVSILVAIIIFVYGLIFIKSNPLILFAFSHAVVIGIISFHGDAMELSRHYVLAGLTLKLAFLFVLVHFFSRLHNNSESNLSPS